MAATSREHDPNWPLLVGFAIALALHVLAIPWLMATVTAAGSGAADPASRHREPPPHTRRLDLGSDTGPAATLAWIPHEDFRKLMARRAPTRQPAVQTKADPAAHAPPRLDATPPVPRTPPTPQEPPAPGKRGEATSLHQKNMPPVPRAKPMASDLPVTQAPGPVFADQSKVESQVENHRTKASASSHRPSTPGRRDKAKPTSAAKSPSEAVPTSLVLQTEPVRPGQVLTAKGLEIHTVHPDFSAVARASTIPDRNPKALITFNPSGDVIAVKLMRSSGADTIDGPVISSLYKWKTRGKMLKKIDKPFSIELTLHLIDE